MIEYKENIYIYIYFFFFFFFFFFLTRTIILIRNFTRLFFFQSLFVCLSVSLSFCLSIYLPVCVSVCLFVCMSVCLSVCLSLSVYLYHLSDFEHTVSLFPCKFVSFFYMPLFFLSFNLFPVYLIHLYISSFCALCPYFVCMHMSVLDIVTEMIDLIIGLCSGSE